MLDCSSSVGYKPTTQDDGNSDNPGEDAGNRKEASNNHNESEDRRDANERVKRSIGLLPSREAANRIPTVWVRHTNLPGTRPIYPRHSGEDF